MTGDYLLLAKTVIQGSVSQEEYLEYDKLFTKNEESWELLDRLIFL